MSRFTTCGLTILLAFAPAALAVDGTVLINQSTITNGLTGCPTGGHFPIIICQSGSYRLSGNVTVPDANTDAIHINADNVTLDLNGFALQGPVTCQQGIIPVQCSVKGQGAGFGIFSNNNNISVSNGAIFGMGSSGITLNGTGERVDGLRVASNLGDGLDSLTGEIIITNCTSTSNQGAGIAINAGTANGNSVSFNGFFGILGSQSGLVVASNNSVRSNEQDGVSNVALAINNTISSNVGFGLSCSAAECAFEGNSFRGNQGGAVKNGTSLGHNFATGLAVF